MAANHFSAQASVTINISITFLLKCGETHSWGKFRFDKGLKCMDTFSLMMIDWDPCGDGEWKQARLNSKGVRKSFTDTIKEFVSYAESQGSTQANFYYSNLTKMEYKALNLIDKFSNDKDFRNQLDLMEISFLITAETICKLAIEEGMRRELTYKEVYQLAKAHVMQYSNVVNQFRTIPSASTVLLTSASK